MLSSYIIILIKYFFSKLLFSPMRCLLSGALFQMRCLFFGAHSKLRCLLFSSLSQIRCPFIGVFFKSRCLLLGALTNLRCLFFGTLSLNWHVSSLAQDCPPAVAAATIQQSMTLIAARLVQGREHRRGQLSHARKWLGRHNPLCMSRRSMLRTRGVLGTRCWVEVVNFKITGHGDSRKDLDMIW